MEQIQIEDLKEFSTEKRIRKKLLGSEKIVAEMVCYEPGQSTPEHPHPKQDEVFDVIEGKCIMTVDGKEIDLEPPSMILIKARRQGPAGQPSGHDVLQSARINEISIIARTHLHRPEAH